MCCGHAGKVSARPGVISHSPFLHFPRLPATDVKELDEKAACCIEPDMRLEMLMCTVAYSIVSAYGLR